MQIHTEIRFNKTLTLLGLQIHCGSLKVDPSPPRLLSALRPCSPCAKAMRCEGFGCFAHAVDASSDADSETRV